MQKQLLDWYDSAHRDLPWRKTKDPYAIWISEIMLQQTRAETVIAYWTRFIARYPSVQALAGAQEQDVLKLWEGLGYYSRARNLLKCAKQITTENDGRFPENVPDLLKLPGIGSYTAGAIASIAFGVRTPAVDGNVERVVSRVCGIREDVGIPSIKRQLYARASGLVPQARPGDFNQAMMELGARICQPVPKCENCPVQAFCDAFEVGDADALPVKQRKNPPRAMQVYIPLVFYQGKVLVYQRSERLLQGLWCFPVVEACEGPEAVARFLEKKGVSVVHERALGEARHVFTHLIWEMEINAFSAAKDTCPPSWQWADAAMLASLPMPTAVKAARKLAMEILSQ